jgi:hypothetical protein
MYMLTLPTLMAVGIHAKGVDAALDASLTLPLSDVIIPGWDFDDFLIQQDCVVPPNATVSSSQSRWVHTAIPSGTPPVGGWPVFIKFEVVGFPDETGRNETCGHAQNHRPVPPGNLPHQKQYDVFELPLASMASCFFPNTSFNLAGCSFDQMGGSLWEQRYKQSLLANGIAVMVLGPSSADNWNWDRDSWAIGEDNLFLTQLMTQIQSTTGTFAHLNPSKIVFQGWSAGAHMVSWMLELQATAAPVVRGVSIVGGVFFSGGSHRCYDNANDPNIPAISDCSKCNASASCFDQRANTGMGCSSTILAQGGVPCCEACCPANVTEDHYLQHPQDYTTHPPCFLAQLTSYDINADLCAAKKYAETLIANGVRADLVLVPKEDEHCYCVGRPGGVGGDGDVLEAQCKNVGRNIMPYPVPFPGLGCMGHSMGFAAAVTPLVTFVTDIVHT